jgi:hypothetical protein
VLRIRNFSEIVGLAMLKLNINRIIQSIEDDERSVKAPKFAALAAEFAVQPKPIEVSDERGTRFYNPLDMDDVDELQSQWFEIYGEIGGEG